MAHWKAVAGRPRARPGSWLHRAAEAPHTHTHQVAVTTSTHPRGMSAAGERPCFTAPLRALITAWRGLVWRGVAWQYASHCLHLASRRRRRLRPDLCHSTRRLPILFGSILASWTLGDPFGGSRRHDSSPPRAVAPQLRQASSWSQRKRGRQRYCPRGSIRNQLNLVRAATWTARIRVVAYIHEAPA